MASGTTPAPRHHQHDARGTTTAAAAASRPLVQHMDVESLWDDKSTFLYNCSLDCLYDMLQQLEQKWLDPELASVNSLDLVAARAKELFKLAPNELTPIQINKQYSCAFMQTLKVLMAINIHREKEQLDELKVRRGTIAFNRIFRVIHGLHGVLQHSYQVLSSWQNSDYSLSTSLIEVQRYTPIDENKAGPKGYLIRHITSRLAAQRLRRCGTDVFQEILSSGHHTHAWQRLCSIKEFIWRNCKRHQDPEAFAYLINGRSVDAEIERYLVEADDVEFPELKRDRHVFSFRNGIFVGYHRGAELAEGQPDYTPNSQFFFYTALEDPDSGITLDDTVVAINYFDVDMPDEEIVKSPFDIPTPEFDKVFLDQKVPENALQWIYVMVGRLFYDLRELDDWEVMLFIKGIAGSGKSTLGKIIRRIYPASCVGYLSSNVQKKFALEGIYDKLIWICYEMRENWADNVDQADLQSMISGGEEVVVNCKFKRPMHMVWTAPGLAIGNQSGGWVDSMGCITRRVVPVEFNEKIRNVDTRLFRKLEKELPLIILKCNQMYHTAVENYCSEGVDIWEAMSISTDYFKNTQAKLRRETNSFADFLENCEALERGEDKFIPYSDLTTKYREYCRRFGVKPQKVSGDNFSHICREEGLEYSDDEDIFVAWAGKSVNKVIWGIGFKQGQEPTAFGGAPAAATAATQ